MSQVSTFDFRQVVILNEKKLADKNKNSAELTEKQKLFCVFYCQSFNATQSYLKVYGGKKNSAYELASRLLRKVEIQAEIKKIQTEMRQEFNFEFNDYVQQLLKIVGADIGDYMKFGRRDEEIVINKKGDTITKTVNFVDLVESDSVDTSVIEEVKQVKGDVTIKLADKMSALKELAKIFGFDEGERKSNLPVVIGGENDLED